MRVIVDEWDNPDSLMPHVFRIELHADTLAEGAMIARMALCFKREPPVCSAFFGKNGSVDGLVWIPKSDCADDFIAKHRGK